MSLFSEARAVIAGGVNSPVRAFAGVGGEPVFFRSASGAWVEAEDGRRFIDYVGSWGPMVLGHAHPGVIEAVKKLRELSPLYEMVQEGVDLSTVQWSAH